MKTLEKWDEISSAVNLGTYEKPLIEVVDLETQGILAASVPGWDGEQFPV